MNTKPVGSLSIGTTFRAPGTSRLWRLSEKSQHEHLCRAVALGPKERHGQDRRYRDGTNEVEQGESDYWASNVIVEIMSEEKLCQQNG